MFHSAKVVRPSSDPLVKPATNFTSLIFRNQPHGHVFLIKFHTFGKAFAAGGSASILFTLLPGDNDNLLRWPLSKIIHFVIRNQLEPLITWTQTTWPDWDPAYKQPTISTKIGVSAFIINNFIPHSKLFGEIEGHLIDDAIFINKILWPSCAKTSKVYLPYLSYSKEPPIDFTSHWSVWFIALHIRLKLWTKINVNS